MDIRMQANLLKQLIRILDRKTSTNTVIPYLPTKPKLPFPAHTKSPLPRITPEEAGISSKYIADFIGEIESDDTLKLQTITIVRNGSIIYEKAFGAYRTDVCHVVYSFSKSVTALAVANERGVSIEEIEKITNENAKRIFRIG